MSFSFPPATKFAPNSRNDAFLARNAASIPGAEREVVISRPLTYDLFKLCFYRCPLRDYLYTAPHTRRRPRGGPLSSRIPTPLARMLPGASRGTVVKSTTISEVSIESCAANGGTGAAGRQATTKGRIRARFRAGER